MNDKIRNTSALKGFQLTPDKYKQLKRAFQDGFTHSKSLNSGKLKLCESIDKNSIYENVLVTGIYPLNGRG